MASERVTTICNSLRAIDCPGLAEILVYVSSVDELFSDGLGLLSDSCVEVIADEVARICVAVVNTQHMASWTPYVNPDRSEKEHVG